MVHVRWYLRGICCFSCFSFFLISFQFQYTLLSKNYFTRIQCNFTKQSQRIILLKYNVIKQNNTKRTTLIHYMVLESIMQM